MKEYRGLSSAEAKKLLEVHGKNELIPEQKRGFLTTLFKTIKQPMFLLLLFAATVYFILGSLIDGAVMLLFVFAIIMIDAVQQWKTDKTLKALSELSAPRVTVVRDNEEMMIPSSEIVPGDLMLLSEGAKISADGRIVKSSDFRVDQSTLTGEAESLFKSEKEEGDGSLCFAGTLVTQGTASVIVEKTGAKTIYGKIGIEVAGAPDRPTPLEKQTARLVKLCSFIAGGLFLAVAAITFINSSGLSFGQRLIEALLAGITLAMAMIPEEFPVIFTVFLAMGAWRLARGNTLVRRLSSVETLGAVSVLCVDKTGTITQNKMTVKQLWAAGDSGEGCLCETLGLACETQAYDPMETAILGYCEGRGVTKDHIFGGKMLLEYPFTSELKIMGHAWMHDGQVIIASKGSPETLLGLCSNEPSVISEALSQVERMSDSGLRVIASARMIVESEEKLPARIEDCRFELCGLVGLEDPPRKSVKEDVAACTRAGVRTVMITGDGAVTAASIARQAGIAFNDRVITGDAIDKMSDEQLCEAVKNTGVFARVMPSHKLRIVTAFKRNGNVTAMTGDGVNDAPALKYADIGIAMGKRGSEVSREAADLVLTDDNFSSIVNTIKEGRRIFENIRRAMGYVIAIHIPIALSSLIAPLLGMSGAQLMILPLHVVLLELIIDPTCSVVLERQPAERDVMSRPPRDVNGGLLPMSLVLKSVLQGLTVFAGAFWLYLSAGSVQIGRTMGLSVIMLSSLLLVLINASEKESVLGTTRRLARDPVLWAVSAATVLGLALMIYTPLSGFLRLAALSPAELALAAGVSGAAVLWYEAVKIVKRGRDARHGA